ncbi:MAG: hypothetical protein NW226_03900 [Microscillaceae bacterium]|nr:hypothetical protein [Microscillaceae bacterium]
MNIELTKTQLIRWINESQNLWLLDLLESMRINLRKKTNPKKLKAIALDTRNFKFDREEANER